MAIFDEFSTTQKWIIFKTFYLTQIISALYDSLIEFSMVIKWSSV